MSYSLRSNRLTALCAAMTCFLIPCVATAEPGNWVTTWGTAPQLTEPANLPPITLAQRTLRQFVRTSIAAKQLRVRFTNAHGNSPVAIQAARVALAAGTGSAGTGEINPETDRALMFQGKAGVIIPAGETVWSDPLDFELPPMADVALSLHFGDLSAITITGHPGSRTTSFIADGDATSKANLPDAAKTDHWYVINAIEALTETGSTISILGDSITDGRGSTTNGQNRWPDLLAKRLLANPPTAEVAVANMGIGGNAIFGGLGPAAVNRFDRDVLRQTGTRYLIVFEGVNDLGGVNDAGAAALAAKLIETYTRFANQARARNIKPYIATITPFGGNSYHTEARESARQTVNQWIRNNSVFDGFIDFDAAVRDPANPVNLLPLYNFQDGLHVNPAGNQAMADAVDLSLFAP